jgi:hypothetical protein
MPGFLDRPGAAENISPDAAGGGRRTEIQRSPLLRRSSRGFAGSHARCGEVEGEASLSLGAKGTLTAAVFVLARAERKAPARWWWEGKMSKKDQTIIRLLETAKMLAIDLDEATVLALALQVAKSKGVRANL